MKYVLLAYGNDEYFDIMSASERDAFERACLANDEELGKNGRLLAMSRLQRSCTATVRVHNNTLFVSDGPFADTKEKLLGIFFIQARDLNEALQVASTMPQARAGPIEVRALLSVDDQQGQG